MSKNKPGRKAMGFEVLNTHITPEQRRWLEKTSCELNKSHAETVRGVFEKAMEVSSENL